VIGINFVLILYFDSSFSQSFSQGFDSSMVQMTISIKNQFIDILERGYFCC